ncbi:chemotaxis protein CheW [Halobiforma nitratireducens]|uniref:Chemotaxis protein CheW n=1 Tax=Halobiforma nitratireducens JCM 10879 TaxID=1227454 RepID=M0LK74_9EURY|nr:chemotaxis protein CheW [Halobiforma nitratireducens]EMA32415.1 chemotaxis protein CheW [Halobiforma nitratireducens JCM 10879]
MTDDRARRIREIRNRSGRSRTESENDEAGTETDDEATSGNAHTEPTEADAGDEGVDGTATPAADSSSEEASSESESGPESEPESRSKATTDGDGDGARDADGNGETVTYDEQGIAGSDDVDNDEDQDQDQDQDTAENDASADESDPEEDESASETETDSDDGLEAMVDAVGDETADGIDPALRGAIAGTGDGSVVGGESIVDASAVGQGEDTYGDATIARRKEVFEQGDSLIASTHNQEDTIQMLEFYLRDSRYAIEIDRVSAIVEMKDITRFPRGPDAIDGVTDLRGEITGVLDPTAMLDVERNELSEDHYIVVLERDDDKQKLGVRVTDVSQAVTYRESQIDDPNSAMDGDVGAQHEFVEGIVKKNTNGETTLVTWLDVDEIIDNISTEHAPAATEA